MEFQKEIEEITNIIEEIKEAVNFPLEEMNSSKSQNITIEDMEVLLSRTQGIIDQLNQKASAISTKMGMSREELSRMIEDPANFGSDEWQAIQAMRQKVDEFHKSLMQSIFQQKNENLINATREEQKKQALKGRKNWLPM